MIIYLKKINYKYYNTIGCDFCEDHINEINKLTSYVILYGKSAVFILLIFVIYMNNNIIKVDIDNLINEKYEKDIDFSKYSSEVKPIAIFIPEVENIYNQFKSISKSNNKSEKIKQKVDLAKRHGIYGFGIYYKWSFENYSKFDNEINIFSDNKTINFPFLLLCEYEDLDKKYNNIMNNPYLETEIETFIKNIKKYLFSKHYIKIDTKPVISISNNYVDDNFKHFISILRYKALENGIGDVFILFSITQKTKELKNLNKLDNILDGIYDLSKNSIFNNNISNNNISYYSGMIYKNIIFNKPNTNCSIYRTSLVQIKNNNYSENNILKDYSPEKFYLLNKIIIEWTNKNYEKNNKFIFINSWNNYKEGNYLEPDEKYGYASINSFSKALFNISYKEIDYNLEYLNNNSNIAVQAHIYYEQLINDIINKTNNIPIKFDLYITTISYQKKNIIDEYIKRNSKANNYEILIVDNKGRDVLPFITQLKTKIKKYKYVCHIHTKKSAHDKNLGSMWRNYLYNNLLGSKEIILEFLNDFESPKNLGFIFPEPYYDIIKKIDNYDNSQFFLHKQNIKYINLILKRIFGKFKVGNKLIFPSGNMFWAKINAIYQIFEIKISKAFPKEKNQTNDTIMHGIERLWLFLVKLNGYYYKMIFRYY